MPRKPHLGTQAQQSAGSISTLRELRLESEVGSFLIPHLSQPELEAPRGWKMWGSDSFRPPPIVPGGSWVCCESELHMGSERNLLSGERIATHGLGKPI